MSHVRTKFDVVFTWKGVRQFFLAGSIVIGSGVLAFMFIPSMVIAALVPVSVYLVRLVFFTSFVPGLIDKARNRRALGRAKKSISALDPLSYPRQKDFEHVVNRLAKDWIRTSSMVSYAQGIKDKGRKQRIEASKTKPAKEKEDKASTAIPPVTKPREVRAAATELKVSERAIAEIKPEPEVRTTEELQKVTDQGDEIKAAAVAISTIAQLQSLDLNQFSSEYAYDQWVKDNKPKIYQSCIGLDIIREYDQTVTDTKKVLTHFLKLKAISVNLMQFADERELEHHLRSQVPAERRKDQRLAAPINTWKALYREVKLADQVWDEEQQQIADVLQRYTDIVTHRKALFGQYTAWIDEVSTWLQKVKAVTQMYLTSRLHGEEMVIQTATCIETLKHAESGLIEIAEDIQALSPQGQEHYQPLWQAVQDQYEQRMQAMQASVVQLSDEAVSALEWIADLGNMVDETSVERTTQELSAIREKVFAIPSLDARKGFVRQIIDLEAHVLKTRREETAGSLQRELSKIADALNQARQNNDQLAALRPSLDIRKRVCSMGLPERRQDLLNQLEAINTVIDACIKINTSIYMLKSEQRIQRIIAWRCSRTENPYTAVERTLATMAAHPSEIVNDEAYMDKIRNDLAHTIHTKIKKLRTKPSDLSMYQPEYEVMDILYAHGIIIGETDTREELQALREKLDHLIPEEKFDKLPQELKQKTRQRIDFLHSSVEDRLDYVSKPQKSLEEVNHNA